MRYTFVLETKTRSKKNGTKKPQGMHFEKV